MARKSPFAERVKEIREARGVSQSDLADKAGLDRAALSRILAGERELRMVHLVELATALDVSLTELAADTTAENVIEAWVPRERLEQSERARIECVRALDISKATTEARLVEVVALKKSLEWANTRIDQLEQEVARGLAAREAADQQREELLELRRRAAEREADQARLAAEVDTLTLTLSDCREEGAGFRRRWEENNAKLFQLQTDMAKAKSASVVAGAVGLFLGKALAESGKRRG